MSIVRQVATLRKREGVPGTLVAQRAGTGASNIYAIEHGRRDPSASTLERIAEAAGVRLLAFPAQGAAFVSETAALLRERAVSGDNAAAYRQLIQISDDIERVTPTTASLLAYIQPPQIDPGWEAAIAGVVEWQLTQKGAPRPEWLRSYGLGVDRRWEPLPAGYEIDPIDVPEPLRRRNVWIQQSELDSV